MKLFGLELTVAKTKSVLQSVYSGGMGGWYSIMEPFAGAWQKNIVADSKQNILAFSAVYACVKLISGDISKLRMKLMSEDDDGILSEVLGDSPFWKVLRQPNEYQTAVQFLSQWIVSKLLWGNTYVYLVREPTRNIVKEMYVLDPRLVKPLITDEGVVYYDLNSDKISGLKNNIVVSADDIMHDRCMCLFHPLVGVSPLYAAASSATQGIRIQNQSALFFENMARPSGVLSSPDKITDETAKRLKRETEEALSGSNAGRILVAGDGLKFEALTMPAVDAQLIQQLEWTVKDVARPFGVPLHKIDAGQDQKFANLAALNQDYYSQTLQELIECIEALFNVRLGVQNVPGKIYTVELDLEGLLRMDPLSRADRYAKLIGAGVLSPNEGRAGENLKPKPGGDSPMLQQQNYSLEALAKRDAKEDPFATAAPKAPAAPALPAPPEPPKPGPGAKEFADVMLLACETTFGKAA